MKLPALEQHVAQQDDTRNNQTRMSLPPCPPSGQGVHSWEMGAANRYRNAGLPEAEAVRLILARISRPPKPANEVEVAVAKAYREWRNRPFVRRYSFPAPLSQRPVAPRPITAVQFDPAKLAAIAGRITAPQNWRHWLWERSPKRPETMNAFSFLAHLYQPGENVLVFDKMDTKTPLGCARIAEPMDCRVPDGIRNGGRYGLGIWFLCNPVDGRWHDTGEVDKSTSKPLLSCRNWQAVTAWRYAVLESDQAPADVWLSFIVQLPIRISAIYTSGSRSVHALLRLDAPSKQEWDETIAPLKRPLKIVGADAGALSAVRLTRLPGCWRPEKPGFQRLLYLSPDPLDIPLMDMPTLLKRAESFARWRSVCPRWNPDKEAFR